MTLKLTEWEAMHLIQSLERSVDFCDFVTIAVFLRLMAVCHFLQNNFWMLLFGLIFIVWLWGS
jgi:hypothetical protein